jgi:hypothetical protein
MTWSVCADLFVGPNVAPTWVVFLLGIHESPNSNFGPQTCYRFRDILCLFYAPQEKCWDRTVKCATMISPVLFQFYHPLTFLPLDKRQSKLLAASVYNLKLNNCCLSSSKRIFSACFPFLEYNCKSSYLMKRNTFSYWR